LKFIVIDQRRREKKGRLVDEVSVDSSSGQVEKGKKSLRSHDQQKKRGKKRKKPPSDLRDNGTGAQDARAMYAVASLKEKKKKKGRISELA